MWCVRFHAPPLVEQASTSCTRSHVTTSKTCTLLSLDLNIELLLDAMHLPFNERIADNQDKTEGEKDGSGTNILLEMLLECSNVTHCLPAMQGKRHAKCIRSVMARRPK